MIYSGIKTVAFTLTLRGVASDDEAQAEVDDLLNTLASCCNDIANSTGHGLQFLEESVFDITAITRDEDEDADDRQAALPGRA